MMIHDSLICVLSMTRSCAHVTLSVRVVSAVSAVGLGPLGVGRRMAASDCGIRWGNTYATERFLDGATLDMNC